MKEKGCSCKNRWTPQHPGRGGEYYNSQYLPEESSPNALGFEFLVSRPERVYIVTFCYCSNRKRIQPLRAHHQPVSCTYEYSLVSSSLPCVSKLEQNGIKSQELPQEGKRTGAREDVSVV